ncbi:MAG TPA: PQQ-binding-like beta-propeller repeat protein, partial [Acidimicrobiia bacterium]|nr:PQQ-binding-like beta-propeller repeat protein [Acidimicrobiia bacterium]
RRALVGLAAGAALLVGVGAAPAGTVGARSPISRPSADDWPTYGHDAQHTFHGRTTLTETTAARLGTAWFFPTGDAVTATPTVVDGVVYVGSWDDTFYAVRLATGQLLWKYALSRQDAVTPYPGEPSRDATSDGGLVTSSAWYQPGNGTRPDLVIFGGGYTLYALNAHTGALYWRHDYTGQPALPPRPEVDGARIFSSPVVSGTKVLFAVDVDGQRGERGYVVAASLDSGSPVWTYETDTDTAGHLLNNGCGNVWSSGSLLPRAGLVVFDEGDCHFSNPPPTSETVFALHVDTGRLAWRFQPHRADNACDFDFGASANVGVNPGGAATFVGVGGKDGTYYSLDPATGHLRWKTNVVFGGFSGGFTGTAAYDGTRVVASTGIGDFGRFESNGNHLCDPSDPADTQMQEPTVHALSANHGAVLWQATGVASFAPTTVAGAMTFNGLALSDAVQVRDAATGRVLVSVSLPAPCWSGIATVGNAVVFGTGASETGEPDGIYALTPGGAGPGR